MLDKGVSGCDSNRNGGACVRILMVNTEYTRGGAARVARTLHGIMNASPDHESLFVYGRGPKAKGSEAVRSCCQPEVYFHGLLTRLTGLQGYGSWLSTKRSIRLMLDWRPDVIHFHNIHGYYLNLSIARAVGKLEIPVVWTLHDAWPLTGRCAYFFECDRWKTGCGHCPDLSRYPKTYRDSSAFMWKRKKAALTQGWNPITVCPSQWLADQVKKSYLSKYRLEVIPNGIDTETFRPREKVATRERLGISAEKKIILFVAADLADERKGARYFFESLQHIKGDDWMVLTLGKRVNLTGKLLAVIDVKQLGFISNRDLLAEVYSAADVLCISSLDEVFGLVVTESMACGTPVVGFRVGGIPEQVTDDCGILVEPRDAQGLGKAITQLLQDDVLRKKMSENCRDRAVAEYSISKFRDRYVKVYSSVIEGDGGQ